MITGVHTMFYSSEADALRQFIKEKLGLASTDVGGGWLIFDIPDAEMGVHPTDFPGSPPTGTHNLSFYCDDIQTTMAELANKGVEFDTPIADYKYGRVTQFTMPGNVKVDLYQPKYTRNPR